MSNSSYRSSHLAKGSDYDSDLRQGDFDSYMLTQENELLKSIVGALFPNKVPRYLDFACGTGRIISTVEKYAETSIGVDVSEAMVSEAKLKCDNSKFIIQDLTQTDFSEEKVNLATAFRFFGNAEQELRVSVLEKLSEVIEPGGYLVLNNHRNPWSIHELLLRLKGDSNNLDLSYKNLSNLLTSNGFSVEKKIGVGIWVYRYDLRESAASSKSILRYLEPLSKLGIFAPFCPDYIVVAKKK